MYIKYQFYQFSSLFAIYEKRYFSLIIETNFQVFKTRKSNYVIASPIQIGLADIIMGF